MSETSLEAFASLCVMMCVYLFVIGFMFQNFAIPSPSMVGTLLVGDHVLVDRTTLAPGSKWMPLMHYRPVQRGRHYCLHEAAYRGAGYDSGEAGDWDSRRQNPSA